jgi:hypothetical protein
MHEGVIAPVIPTAKEQVGGPHRFGGASLVASGELDWERAADGNT